MRLGIVLIFVLALYINVTLCKQKPQYEDNDFAEFEDFDEDASKNTVKTPEHLPTANAGVPKNDDQIKIEQVIKPPIKPEDEDEAIVEEENDEFSHLADEDEFIGFNTEKGSAGNSVNNGEAKINIAKVPLHLRSNWDSFYLEMLMLLGLVIYFLNYMFGKGKNQTIATAWFNCHKSLLENNFALVGDDGKNEIEVHGLRKESENIYLLWCSGRLMMEGMLVEIRLLKRQDIIAVISQMIRPSNDQLVIQMKLEEMDPFVFAIATKKSASKVLKEMTDISTYCPEKKLGEKFGLNSQYVVHSELSELTNTFTRDPRILAVMSKYPGTLDYIHLSDQFSGPKQQEETAPTTLPEVTKTLTFAFSFEGKRRATPDAFDNMIPLMQLVIYLSDKVSRLRLSKEMKNRADKNRTRVEEAFLKATHQARAELALQDREDKRKEERERIMNLDDPEKQRKWEEKEQKRQMKRRTPKMKTLKIKPM